MGWHQSVTTTYKTTPCALYEPYDVEMSPPLFSEAHHKTGAVGLIGLIADVGIDGVAKGLRNTKANSTATMTGPAVDTHKRLENLTDLIGWDAIAIITDQDFAMPRIEA